MNKKFILTIIIILAAAAVAWYFIKTSEPELPAELQQEQQVAEQEIDSLMNVSDSDDINVIEQELQDTNLDTLDKELSDIEKQLQEAGF